MMFLSIEEEKERIRREARSRRRSLLSEEKTAMDLKICGEIETLPAFLTASVVLTYVSLPDEPDTLELIQRALLQHKTVCAPVSDPEICRISFYRIDSIADLKTGAYGIREPDPTRSEMVTDLPDTAVCLVPGLAFDQDGFRVGYGKGYYDRYLEQFSGTRIGICYDDNLFAQLPRGAHDQSVDWLVTEKRSIRINHREEKRI